jgi:hypothetical protein
VDFSGKHEPEWRFPKATKAKKGDLTVSFKGIASEFQ